MTLQKENYQIMLTLGKDWQLVIIIGSYVYGMKSICTNHL